MRGFPRFGVKITPKTVRPIAAVRKPRRLAKKIVYRQR